MLMGKFDIDQNTIKETSNCKHGFCCLDGDFARCCGGVEFHDEDLLLLCKGADNPGFCSCKMPYSASRIACTCFVRKEIFNKYGL